MSQSAADPASLPPLPKDHLSHPEQWATGSDPATSKQKGFIKVLEKQHPDAAPEGGIDVDGMQKGEASEVIEKLKNGEPVEATSGGDKEEKVEGLMGEIKGIVDEDNDDKGESTKVKDDDDKEDPIHAKPSSQTNGHSTSSPSKGKRITSESNGKPTGDPSASFSDLVSTHETKKAEAAAVPPSSSQARPPSSQISEQVDYSGVDKNPTKQTTLDAHVAPAQAGENGRSIHSEEKEKNGDAEKEVENGENGPAEGDEESGSKSDRKRKEKGGAVDEDGGVAKKTKVVGKTTEEAVGEIVADNKE